MGGQGPRPLPQLSATEDRPAHKHSMKVTKVCYMHFTTIILTVQSSMCVCEKDLYTKGGGGLDNVCSYQICIWIYLNVDINLSIWLIAVSISISIKENCIWICIDIFLYLISSYICNFIWPHISLINFKLKQIIILI